MESPLGPALANIFVVFHEKGLLSSPNKPEVYFLWQQHWGRLILYFPFHPALRFTLDRETNLRLHFPDVLVCRTPLYYVTLIYRCHVVSHWEDRNKISTILVFELTVASRQRMTIKNRCLYSVTSLRSPDTGRKKVEAKWLAGTLKTEVAPSSRQRKKNKKN